MTIYQLECFIAVAEELNFSAAAERLFTTQPAITYQINALEKETGLHLFERTTRRTKLTAAGQSFYLDMVQMTSFGRQALKKAQDIQEADRSRLTVGLRQLAQVGVDCSKISPSFEGALIMIQMGTAMSIVPCLSTAVIPGIVKVPLLDFPPVTVEIAAMRHAPRLEVQSFIEIAKQKYAHPHDPLLMETLI